MKTAIVASLLLVALLGVGIVAASSVARPVGMTSVAGGTGSGMNGGMMGGGMMGSGMGDGAMHGQMNGTCPCCSGGPPS
ncbi:MAG: hypothetical protein HY557_04295 [Euryarchaeota archaeon]|nr:hypothetical protein [Euryarchaeota archaeon]